MSSHLEENDLLVHVFKSWNCDVGVSYASFDETLRLRVMFATRDFVCSISHTDDLVDERFSDIIKVDK